MGGRASKEGTESRFASEIKSMESRAASSGELPRLQAVFSHLAGPNRHFIASQALESLFDLKFESNGKLVNSKLSLMVEKLSSTLVDVAFEADEDSGICWRMFLRGYENCHPPAASAKLNFLLYCLFHLRKNAELPLSFTVLNEEHGHIEHIHMEGFMTYEQLREFLWLCWLIGFDARMPSQENIVVELPDLRPLLTVAAMSSTSQTSEFEYTELPVEKLYSWMLRTIPGLGMGLCEYIQTRVHRAAVILQSHSIKEIYEQQSKFILQNRQLTENVLERFLLSSEISWAVGLSQPDAVGQRLIASAYSSSREPALPLYRSSAHGKGMNRFWAHVEGYHGTVLFLISGILPLPEEKHLVENVGKNEVLIGCLVREGFENKSCFYGSSGCTLLALKPLFQLLRSTGKGSNYVYSHSHILGHNYHQKMPEGIGFGGDIGKERVWLDEDFSCVTLRHHVVDKTYVPECLLPCQDYAPLIMEAIQVEVWGLGGQTVKENQAKYHQRENLFSEQKRKVDLKAFGNWADSPEKVMLDLVSDPNKVKREER